MRYFALLLAVMMATLACAARYSPSRSKVIAFCIQNDDAQMMCTNHCAKGRTCTATCGGGKWRVTVNSETAKANFVNKVHHHAHVRQDQWPCSHWAVENHVSTQELCPKSVNGTPNKLCMDVKSGVVRKAGYIGVI